MFRRSTVLRTAKKSGVTWAVRRASLQRGVAAVAEAEASLVLEQALRHAHHYYALNHWLWVVEALPEVPAACLAVLDTLGERTPSHAGVWHHRLCLVERGALDFEKECARKFLHLLGHRFPTSL